MEKKITTDSIEELETKPISVADLHPVVCADRNISMFLDSDEFGQGMRGAMMMSKTKGMVAKEYEGNPSNCFFSLSMAKALNITPYMFSQWSYFVNGKVGLESKAIISIANASGMFKRGIEFEELGSQKDGDEWGFRAFAEDVRYGTIIEEIFTMGDAKSAGWINNTWWKKLPRMMLKYRAASFLIKMNRPELLGGMNVVEEMRDEFAANPVKDITDEARELNKKPIVFNDSPEPEPEKEKLVPEKKAQTAKKTAAKEPEMPEACWELQSYLNNTDKKMVRIVDEVMNRHGADDAVMKDAIQRGNEEACAAMVKDIEDMMSTDKKQEMV